LVEGYEGGRIEDLPRGAILDRPEDARLFSFQPGKRLFEDRDVVLYALRGGVAGAEERSFGVRKIPGFDCRDYCADVIRFKAYDLAFVFAAGKGLYDIAMEIWMLPPVSQFDGLRAQAKAVFLKIDAAMLEIRHEKFFAGEIHVEAHVSFLSLFVRPPPWGPRKGTAPWWRLERVGV
jgi:hypothetical protein